jgi:hypothetical protein
MAATSGLDYSKPPYSTPRRSDGLIQSLYFEFATGNLLLVDCFQHFAPALDRWLGERLTLPQLNQYLGLLKLLLILFERFVYVFAIF